jgi:aminocarboxymuconate-semialdehyde decarboxylase
MIDEGVDPAVALGGDRGAMQALLKDSHRSGPATRRPSDYLRSFYYDCCTYTGATLRFLIDTVGIDRVVFGTDYPAPMVITDAVRWVDGLDELDSYEKEAILSRNPANLVGM